MEKDREEREMEKASCERQVASLNDALDGMSLDGAFYKIARLLL